MAKVWCMEWEVIPDKISPNEWRVEAIDGDGSVFVALFSGPEAEKRAREYAEFKQGKVIET